MNINYNKKYGLKYLLIKQSHVTKYTDVFLEKTILFTLIFMLAEIFDTFYKKTNYF
jgi:hypothetical protein